MFIATMDVRLSDDERQLLRGMLRATTISAGLARRARVILALADGHSYAEIGAMYDGTDAYIARWKQRASSRIAWSATSQATIRTLRPKRPM
jgi:hypothetical protein